MDRSKKNTKKKTIQKIEEFNNENESKRLF